MGDLVAALEGLNGAVAPEMATFAPVIGRGRNDAPSFGGSPVPEEDFYMVDLGVLLQRLEPPGAAPRRRRRRRPRPSSTGWWWPADAGEAAAGATGMTIHFPPYPDYYYEYWYRATEAPVWPEFLAAYYTAGAEIPADKRSPRSPRSTTRPASTSTTSGSTSRPSSTTAPWTTSSKPCSTPGWWRTTAR